MTRPRHIGKSHSFIELVEAVQWAEKEMVELANQPDVPEPPPYFGSDEQIEADRARMQKKLVGGPFWIDPATLEHKQITYKVYIELNAYPVSFKTLELEASDPLRYDERYLSPSKLSETLNLDIDRFDIDQPIGENTDLYQITSLTTLFQEISAADQAQKAWDQSRILQQFKAGKIRWAAGGYLDIPRGLVPLP